MTEDNKTTGDGADKTSGKNTAEGADKGTDKSAENPGNKAAGSGDNKSAEGKGRPKSKQPGQPPEKPPGSADKSSEPDKQYLPEPLVLDDIAVAKAKRNKRSLPVVSLILIVILLGVVAGGGYYGWQHFQQWLEQQRQGDGALQELVEARIETQQQKIAELEQTLQRQAAEQQERLQANGQQLDQLRQRVTSQGSRLRDLSTSTRDDWLLAEAEYLLRLANQRLLTERTTANPVSLLETADDILKDFDDPDLYAVRKQIAADITSMRVAGTLDREGLYLQLASLSEVIPQLQLLVKPWDSDAGQVAETVDEPAEQLDSWGGRMLGNVSNFADSLKNYVRIRHRDKPLEPLLGEEEEVYLRHNLRSMLEQAQLALLREEPQIYRASLQKCRDWLQRYFELNRTAEVLIEQLDQLGQQTVTQQLPDITGSLEALRSYINLWHLRHQAPQESRQESGQ